MRFNTVQDNRRLVYTVPNFCFSPEGHGGGGGRNGYYWAPRHFYPQFFINRQLAGGAVPVDLDNEMVVYKRTTPERRVTSSYETPGYRMFF